MQVLTIYEKHIIKDLIRNIHIKLVVLLKAGQNYGSHYASRLQQTLIWHFFKLVILMSVDIEFL